MDTEPRTEEQGLEKTAATLAAMKAQANIANYLAQEQDSPEAEAFLDSARVEFDIVIRETEPVLMRDLLFFTHGNADLTESIIQKTYETAFMNSSNLGEYTSVHEWLHMIALDVYKQERTDDSDIGEPEEDNLLEVVRFEGVSHPEIIELHAAIQSALSQQIRELDPKQALSLPFSTT